MSHCNHCCDYLVPRQVLVFECCHVTQHSCSEQKCALDCIEATTTIRVSCTFKCMLSLTMDAHGRMKRAAIPLMIRRCCDDHSESSELYSRCSCYGLGCSIAGSWIKKQRLLSGFGRPVFGQSGSRCDQNLVLRRPHVPPRFAVTHFLLLLVTPQHHFDHFHLPTNLSPKRALKPAFPSHA